MSPCFFLRTQYTPIRAPAMVLVAPMSGPIQAQATTVGCSFSQALLGFSSFAPVESLLDLLGFSSGAPVDFLLCFSSGAPVDSLLGILGFSSYAPVDSLFD